MYHDSGAVGCRRYLRHGCARGGGDQVALGAALVEVGAAKVYLAAMSSLTVTLLARLRG